MPMHNHKTTSLPGLRRWRLRNGMTLPALSERTGLSVPHLSRLERGQRRASLGTVALLGAAVPIEEVIGELTAVADEAQ